MNGHQIYQTSIHLAINVHGAFYKLNSKPKTIPEQLKSVLQQTQDGLPQTFRVITRSSKSPANFHH